eukprot:CAMPEP_0194122760 /NCGR_PEP_ID=MMETSP0150-20130528/51947_1 /TAXON_ID=122233 /ORGANISM="Chaetoceros debilis, Strain MM31A-1" /LENGTH=106 /DNA_ID=CAMNT_0038815745 /DNA_START=126 /DNA_END=443 /DNA_ORIENTATION=+
MSNISISNTALPNNLVEASIPNDERAIVITEANKPFKIVSVNSSWEQLCGYSQNECKGRTLECIQGERTNRAAVSAVVQKVLSRDTESYTVLKNYHKNGREFQNKL